MKHRMLDSAQINLEVEELAMTYLFKSKATGDLLMLEASGDQRLGIIGKEPDTAAASSRTHRQGACRWPGPPRGCWPERSRA